MSQLTTEKGLRRAGLTAVGALGAVTFVAGVVLSAFGAERPVLLVTAAALIVVSLVADRIASLTVKGGGVELTTALGQIAAASAVTKSAADEIESIAEATDEGGRPTLDSAADRLRSLSRQLSGLVTDQEILGLTTRYASAASDSRGDSHTLWANVEFLRVGSGRGLSLVGNVRDDNGLLWGHLNAIDFEAADLNQVSKWNVRMRALEAGTYEVEWVLERGDGTQFPIKAETIAVPQELKPIDIGVSLP